LDFSNTLLASLLGTQLEHKALYPVAAQGFRARIARNEVVVKRPLVARLLLGVSSSKGRMSLYST